MKKFTGNYLLNSAGTATFSFLSLVASAQLYIPSGATLNISGSALLYAGANLINDGTLNLGTGTLVLERDLIDNGTFNAGNGTVKFTGGITQNFNPGPGASLKDIIMDKSANDAVVDGTSPDISLSGSLILASGKLDINNRNLVAQTITGGSSSSYVKTSGTGKLKRNLDGSINYIFPVGNSSYNPVTITNNTGFIDVFSARVVDEIYDAGLSGSVITRGRVKRTWDIQKTNPNAGSGVNLVFGYSPSDATGLLNPVMNHFRSGYWMPQYGSYSSDPGVNFTYSGYTGSFSPFSIQEYYTSNLGLKAYIQGYYTGSGTMAPTLLNSGISGATSSQSDSITVSLHDAENGNQIGAAVKTILNTDGTAAAQFQGTSGPYYIAIKHRNSLETWSSTAVILNPDGNYDFSTAANKAYGDNQKNIGGGVFGIFSGDINGDGVIESTDYLQTENDIPLILFGYSNTDLTGDGIVESSDYLLMENNVPLILFAQKPF